MGQQPGKPWVAFSSSLENTILLLERFELSGTLGHRVWGKKHQGEIKRTNAKTKGSLCTLFHLAHQNLQ